MQVLYAILKENRFRFTEQGVVNQINTFPMLI
jgi:hypothetical protein